MKKSPTLGRLLLLAATLIWGSSFLVTKNTLDSISTPVLLSIRFSGAGLLLAVIFRKRLKRISRATLLHGMVVGVVLTASYLAQTYGLERTTAGKNAFLVAVYTLLVPFVNWLLFRRRPAARNWGAALLCLMGIGLVSLDGDLTIDTGEWLSLLSGLFYAFQVTLLSRWGEEDDMLAATVVQFLTVAVILLVYTLLTEPIPWRVPADCLPALIYLSLLCTAAALLLQNLGQSMTPASQSAILLSLESVFGFLIATLVGGEALTLRLGLGFLLIFLAVLVSEGGLRIPFLRRKE